MEQEGCKLEGFTDLEILGLRPGGDVAGFVKKWFDIYDDKQSNVNASGLNTHLENQIRLQALAINPLLLSFIILFYQTEPNHLTQPLALLYEQCIERLAEWNRSRYSSYLPMNYVDGNNSSGGSVAGKGGGLFSSPLRKLLPNATKTSSPTQKSPEDILETKLKLMGTIAWQIHQGLDISYSQKDLLEIVKKDLPVSSVLAQVEKMSPEETFLEEIIAIHGILGMRGQKDLKKYYGFLCLSLQEYFAAKHASEDRNAGKEVLGKLADDPWWGEVKLLCTAIQQR